MTKLCATCVAMILTVSALNLSGQSPTNATQAAIKPSFTITPQPSPKKYPHDDDPIWQIRSVTELIVVHHSATPNGNVTTITEDHKGKPSEFNDIGYHFVITNGDGGPDGKVHVGRDEQVVGAHDIKEGRNFRSLGICLVGTAAFTDKQKEALVELLAKLCGKYKIEPSTSTIVSHRSGCPGRGIDFDTIVSLTKAKLHKKEK